MSHEKYMRIALSFAYRGLGQTWPNPSVGCVIVKDGEIIGRGRTAKDGRPHAERIALDVAGKKAKGATAYVTLEPCSHHGKTPPCAEGLIAAGISAVVVACTDPDKRVSGKGIAMLRKAGIEVIEGVCEEEALELNKGFFKRIKTGLPYVMLKAAISADGKYLEGIAHKTLFAPPPSPPDRRGEERYFPPDRRGDSITEPPPYEGGLRGVRWVTGELSRNMVHKLRSQYDVIITGTGTVIADNPQLNVRLPGMENYSPLKVVIGKREIPSESGVLRFEGNDLKGALKEFGKQGITRVMVEAGPKLSNAFLKEKLVDEVIIFQSPNKLGKAEKNFFSKNALEGLVQAERKEVGTDLMLRLTRSPTLARIS